MRWLAFIPAKATLVLLFNAAKRRLSEQTDNVAQLPDERLVSATEELNQIADDVRDAQAAPEATREATEATVALPPDNPSPDTGKQASSEIRHAGSG